MALDRLPPEARDALELAAARVRAFHQHQVDAGFRYEDAGITLGCRVLPVARAGVYAPGGKARYPSSVIMSAVPAQVAGVKEIILAMPLSGGEADDLNPGAAAHLSGVTAIVDAGGAQAIAALAYGTQSVPRVDKIVGPGNIYVACAKRLVFGAVDIDGIAGPSEILVVATDDEADPRIVARRPPCRRRSTTKPRIRCWSACRISCARPWLTSSKGSSRRCPARSDRPRGPGERRDGHSWRVRASAWPPSPIVSPSSTWLCTSPTPTRSFR